MRHVPDLQLDGDETAPLLLLAHGAGAPMDSAWMQDMTHRLVARGLRVGRFEFPYMAARRAGGLRRAPDRGAVLLDAWRAVVEGVGGGTVAAVGGKSMGGRMASMVADEVEARALVCFGYPFHPPGAPEKMRTAHLASLITPTTILQGDRDPFGTPEEVAGYSLSPAIRVHWFADGDHDLRPRVRSGHTYAGHLDEAARLAAEAVMAVT